MKIIIFICGFLIAVSSIAQEPQMVISAGHTGVVGDAFFSPDEKFVITQANEIKLWERKSGLLLKTYDLPGKKATSVSLSNDNKILVISYDADSLICIWDTYSGKIVKKIKGTQALLSKNDDKIIINLGDDHISVYRLKDWKLVVKFPGLAGRYSKDESHFLSAYLDKVLLWDSAGKKLNEFDGYLVGASADLKYIALDRDSIITVGNMLQDTLVANFSRDANQTFNIRFVEDQQCMLVKTTVTDAKNFTDSSYVFALHMKTLKRIIDYVDKEIENPNLNAATDSGKFVYVPNRSVQHIIPSKNGAYFMATYMDGKIRVWETLTGKLVSRIQRDNSLIAYTNEGSSILPYFSKDEKYIITATVYAAKVYEVATGAINKSFDLGSSKPSVTFSPDGKYFLTSAYDTLQIWQANTGKLLYTQKRNSFLDEISFTPDSKYLCVGSKDNGAIINISAAERQDFRSTFYWTAQSFNSDLQILLAASGDTLNVFQFPDFSPKIKIAPFDKPIDNAIISPSGKFIAVSVDGGLYIVDGKTGKLLYRFNDTERQLQLDFSPGEEFILHTAKSGTISIYDLRKGQLVKKNLKYNDGKTINTYYHPIVFSGKQFFFGKPFNYDDGVLDVWDLNGNIVKTISAGSYGQAFKKDNNTILFTNHYTGKDKLYDLSKDTFKEIIFPSSYVEDFSAASGWLAFVNGTEISFSDIKDQKPLYKLILLSGKAHLFMDKDNRYDGTEEARKLLYFTCGTEIIELAQVKDQLWVPDLAVRMMKGEVINAPKLSDLEICGLTPEVETISSNDYYNFKILPRRGGLGETALYVNNIEIKRYKPAQLKKVAAGYELNIEKTSLQSYFIPGVENAVTVKAFTANNEIASRGNGVLHLDKKKTTAPNFFGIMVGVSDYKGDGLDLKYAAKDAQDLSGAVAASARKLLNTDGKEHVFMYNINTSDARSSFPEKKSIQQAFKEVSAKATANDILFIFFAGHGVMAGDKKQFYFLTADASVNSNFIETGISVDELSAWMRPDIIKAQKRILVFDACNSGQAINDLVKIGQQTDNYLAARNDDNSLQVKAIDKLNEKSGLFILSASASNQSAYEMGRYSQGLLTYSLLKTIKQNPAILEDNKFLNVSGWFNAAERAVSELVRETGNRQEPQIVSTANFNIGIIDEEVMAGIILPEEKPVFVASKLLNKDESILDDDAGLGKLIDKKLSDISSRGKEAPITFTSTNNSKEAYLLTGSYEVKGSAIHCRLNLRKGGITVNSFEIAGSMEALDKLATSIATKTMEWMTNNKR